MRGCRTGIMLDEIKCVTPKPIAHMPIRIAKRCTAIHYWLIQTCFAFLTSTTPRSSDIPPPSPPLRRRRIGVPSRAPGRPPRRPAAARDRSVITSTTVPIASPPPSRPGDATNRPSRSRDVGGASETPAARRARAASGGAAQTSPPPINGEHSPVTDGGRAATDDVTSADAESDCPEALRSVDCRGRRRQKALVSNPELL